MNRIEKLKTENEKLRGFLERAGWGPCNIPACNCPGWHKIRLSRDEQEEFSKNLSIRIALRTLYNEVADYIKINNLGDVHHNAAMKIARDVLNHD